MEIPIVLREELVLGYAIIQQVNHQLLNPCLSAVVQELRPVIGIWSGWIACLIAISHMEIRLKTGSIFSWLMRFLASIGSFSLSRRVQRAMCVSSKTFIRSPRTFLRFRHCRNQYCRGWKTGL